MLCGLFWCLGGLRFGLDAGGLFAVIYDDLFIWLSGLGGFVVGSVWVSCVG